MIRLPLTVVLVSLLCGACATRGSVRQLASDLKDVHSELGSLRASQETLMRQVHDANVAAQASQAATEDLRGTVGRTNEEMVRLSKRLDATDENVRYVNETTTRLTAAAAPASPAMPETRRERPLRGADTLFGAGLTSFRAREYGQAILYFLDVVTRYPTHELAPVAQYWIGESYFLQHDHRQALLEFRRVVDWPSVNPKIPDALVKMGLCYTTLREGFRAQEAWRRVAREYPGSPAAAQARTLLSSQRSSSYR